MRVVVYGKPRQRECAAMAEGCEALGHRVTWRNHGWWDEAGDYFEDAGLVVTFGQRLWSGVIADAYRRRGVPVLTVDLPPIRREGYRALWLDRINWMPAGKCDADRLAKMRLHFSPLRDAGDTILVCGQVSGDAAHQMNAKQMRTWAESVIGYLRDAGYSVLWRPHPQDPFPIDGVRRSDPDTPLEEELRLGTWAIVTHNSTSGITSILEGVPVVCAPDCFYAELCSDSLECMADPYWPTLAERWDFFSRLAYVQWTFDELASGEAMRFVLGQTDKIKQPVMAA